MAKNIFVSLICLIGLGCVTRADGQTTNLVVAYASPAATFCPGVIAKRDGIFAKYGLDVEMVLMQGASAYMPALANGNIQFLYGGGTAVSRAIATGGFDFVVIATETRYVPLRMMVNASIQTPGQLKGKRLAGGVPSRAAAMKQGLIDGVAVNPPNEYELEKAGYRELANFLDFKMPYAGGPHTVSRAFRDKNRKVVEDYMTAIVEGIQIFRTNRQAAYRAIFGLTRPKDPGPPDGTFDSY